MSSFKKVAARESIRSRWDLANRHFAAVILKVRAFHAKKLATVYAGGISAGNELPMGLKGSRPILFPFCSGGRRDKAKLTVTAGFVVEPRSVKRYHASACKTARESTISRRDVRIRAHRKQLRT